MRKDPHFSSSSRRICRLSPRYFSTRFLKFQALVDARFFKPFLRNIFDVVASEFLERAEVELALA